MNDIRQIKIGKSRSIALSACGE